MTTAPQHPSVPDHDHVGLTVPELLDVLDGRPPVRPATSRRTPALVAGAREVGAVVRRAAPPAAAAVSAAAATAGSFTARHVRTAWRTYEAWPRRVEPRRTEPGAAGRRPGTGPGRLR